MIADIVTLVVKAPNQQIEDQYIECESSWTVRELKVHLSEVYPSKPKTDEQKIIYSGRLLDDNTVLKDILRCYECPTHTMHLVCTPKMDAVEHDGLRQRRTGPEPALRPETRQNDQNHTVELQNYLSSFVNNYGRVPPYTNYMNERIPVPNDPALMANHMMMMQQAYMQYMQQYAQLYQPQPQPPAAAPARPPAPAPPPAAGLRDEEAADWLDHLYSASRVALLMSLLYLYGSPARLLLVIILVAAGYLHHIGFFRDLLLNQNNQRNENRQPNPERPQPERPQPERPRHPETPPSPETAQTPLLNPQNEEQSLLAVTWTLFTTFFASLIPEAN